MTRPLVLTFLTTGALASSSHSTLGGALPRLHTPHIHTTTSHHFSTSQSSCTAHTPPLPAPTPLSLMPVVVGLYRAFLNCAALVVAFDLG